MRYFKVLLSISASAVLTCGCVNHYYPKPNPAKAVPDNSEITGITGVRHQVPVVVNVIAANDMTGQNKSIWDGSPLGWRYLYHYPLKQLVGDCYNNIVYKVFDQPGGEVIDSFELKVTPLTSLLSEDSPKVQYTLTVLVNFYEPGGKLIYGEKFDGSKYGNFNGPNEVPDVIYTTIKGVAVESITKILKDKKVITALARFKDK
jgi:hypothetical protein